MAVKTAVVLVASVPRLMQLWTQLHLAQLQVDQAAAVAAAMLITALMITTAVSQATLTMTCMLEVEAMAVARVEQAALNVSQVAARTTIGAMRASTPGGRAAAVTTAFPARACLRW